MNRLCSCYSLTKTAEELTNITLKAIALHSAASALSISAIEIWPHLFNFSVPNLTMRLIVARETPVISAACDWVTWLGRGCVSA